MSQEAAAQSQPPQLKASPSGEIDTASAADVLEWFLNYDERVARMRHPYAEELFQWKQSDDAASGVGTYPFENAEARFAIGVIQALKENDSEPLLKLWITDVLEALHHARETKIEMTDAYKLDSDPEAFAIKKSEKLTSAAEKKIYLTCCWLETLCTAEARVLGWMYQAAYGKPYSSS